MNKIPRNKIIGAGCMVSSGFARLGGTVLRDTLPNSGFIGWFSGVILLLCAVYFFSKQTAG